MSADPTAKSAPTHLSDDAGGHRCDLGVLLREDAGGDGGDLGVLLREDAGGDGGDMGVLLLADERGRGESDGSHGGGCVTEFEGVDGVRGLGAVRVQV